MTVELYFSILEFISYMILGFSVVTIIYITMIDRKNKISKQKITMEKLKITEQLLRQDQCNYLKSLGLDLSGSGWCRITYRGCATEITETPGPDRKRELIDDYHDTIEETLTLQEILKLLPDTLGNSELTMTPRKIGYADIITFEIKDGNYLDGTYELLCWLLENKKI